MKKKVKEKEEYNWMNEVDRKESIFELVYHNKK